ncbi:MAG: RNA 2',3'-cyclic phosphodiesterase [Thermaerobacterales bacterium]
MISIREDIPGAIRCFAAVAVDPSVKASVASWQSGLAGHERCIRWVDPSNYHITLKFFGSMSADELIGLQQRLRRSVRNQPSFDVELQGLGVFPSWRQVRIICLGVGWGRQDLVRLASLVERDSVLNSRLTPPGPICELLDFQEFGRC